MCNFNWYSKLSKRNYINAVFLYILNKHDNKYNNNYDTDCVRCFDGESHVSRDAPLKTHLGIVLCRNMSACQSAKIVFLIKAKYTNYPAITYLYIVCINFREIAP